MFCSICVNYFIFSTENVLGVGLVLDEIFLVLEFRNIAQRLILHNAQLLFGNIWVVSNKKIFRTLNNLGSQSLKKDYSIEYLILFGWSLMENYNFLKSTRYSLGGH